MRFVALSILFLGWAYYEMSGGAAFEPPETVATLPAPLPVVETAAISPLGLAPLSRNDAASERTAPSSPARAAGAVEAAPGAGPRIDTDAAVAQALLAPGIAPTDLGDADRRDATFDDSGRPTVRLVSLEDSSAFFAQPTTALPALPEPVAEPADIRSITGRSVNMRAGPGTRFSVIARHRRGDEMLVLEDNGKGWLRLRPAGSDTGEGWIAAFLLSDPLR